MFTAWWARATGAPAPSDRDLGAPLEVMGAAVHVAGTPEFRYAWTAPTGEDRVGVAVDAATGTIALGWARVDNKHDLRAGLGHQSAPSSDAHVSEWLLAAYLRWGEQAPAHLVGDYSVVVYDPRRPGLLIWRDAIGVRPLFVAEAGEAIAVSTTIAGLLPLSGVDSRLNPSWVVHHSLGITTHHNSTPYQAIARLEPGRWLRVDPQSTLSSAYHQFNPWSPWRKDTDEDWVRAFRAQLERAVADRLPQGGPVAAEMTAGLDSSSILGLLASPGTKATADAVHGFGIVTYSDPEGLITATADFHGIDSVTTTPSWTDDEKAHGVDRITTALGYRNTHGMVTSMIPTYRLAANAGARTLFSGHGGDQAVSSPAQKALLEWVDRGDWWGAVKQGAAPGWKAPLRVVRQVRNIEGDLRERPDDLRSLWLSTGLTVQAMRDAGVPEILNGDFAGTWARSVNGEVIDAAGRLLIGVQGYWSRRAEECSVAAALAGVEYVWPLLDTRLIQQYLSTPTVEKFHAGRSRFLFRRAISPFVPPAVTWRPSKAPGGRPQEVSRARISEGLPLDWRHAHPLVVEVIDPDVFACGEVGPIGSYSRMSRWRMREADAWLRAHHGETGAGASAV